MQNNNSPEKWQIIKRILWTVLGWYKTIFSYWQLKRLIAFKKCLSLKGMNELKTYIFTYAGFFNKALPGIVASNQAAYFKCRFMQIKCRLLDDLLELCDTINKEGYIVNIDFENAFDSVNHIIWLNYLNNLALQNYLLNGLRLYWIIKNIVRILYQKRWKNK